MSTTKTFVALSGQARASIKFPDLVRDGGNPLLRTQGLAAYFYHA
jgi:hypothetical protein